MVMGAEQCLDSQLHRGIARTSVLEEFGACPRFGQFACRDEDLSLVHGQLSQSKVISFFNARAAANSRNEIGAFFCG
jgi:hypothetical protein